MNESLRESVRAVMADVFEIEAASIADQATSRSIEQWDSANHVRLVLALEEEFGVMFDVAEIESMVRLENIVDALARKL
jgi:acyl carrier protein